MIRLVTGSLVLTVRGYVPVETLVAGSRVWSNSKWDTVTGVAAAEAVPAVTLKPYTSLAVTLPVNTTPVVLPVKAGCKTVQGGDLRAGRAGDLHRGDRIALPAWFAPLPVPRLPGGIEIQGDGWWSVGRLLLAQRAPRQRLVVPVGVEGSTLLKQKLRESVGGDWQGCGTHIDCHYPALVEWLAEEFPGHRPPGWLLGISQADAYLVVAGMVRDFRGTQRKGLPCRNQARSALLLRDLLVVAGLSPSLYHTPDRLRVFVTQPDRSAEITDGYRLVPLVSSLSLPSPLPTWELTTLLGNSVVADGVVIFV